MSTFDDMLKQAATPTALMPEANADAAWTPPVQIKMGNLVSNAQNKQQAVLGASEGKKAALMTPTQYFQNAVGALSGAGQTSATPVEQDLRNLSAFDVIAKYGAEQGTELLQGQIGGERQITQIESGTRDPLQKWDDANVDITAGLAGAIGGIGSLAAGAVNADAGTTVAGATQDAIDFLNSERSPQLAGRQRLNEARNALTSRDSAEKLRTSLKSSEAQFAEDKKTDGDFVAGLKRIGRDSIAHAQRFGSEVIDSIDNAAEDSAVVGSGIANALGSFAAMGPIGRGLAAATGGRAGMTTAIAATEGGGAYQQITADIADRDFDTLRKESPMFNELVASGMSPEDARITVANRTGLLSGAITAPVAAATGRLVSKFEGDLGAFSRGSLTQNLANVGREALEEFTQSGAGQLAQNVAESQLANTNKSISEGVGRAAGEGALYGAGMSGALAIPGVARNAAGKAVSAIAERAAGVEEANKKASPVSDETVAKAATEMAATASEAETVLREAAGTDEATNAYVDQLMAATRFDPMIDAPASLAPQLEGVTTKVDAAQRLADIVSSAEDGSNDQLRAGYALYNLVQDLDGVLNADPAALANLPEDSQARAIDTQYQNLLGAIGSTPKVMGAIQTVMEMVQQAEAKKADVTAESLATPEGQQEAADVISTAEMAPEKVDLGTAEKILYQVSQGNLTVTPRQKAALDTSVALLRAVQAADQAAVASGEADPVSLNISSVDSEKGKSLIQHAKGIMSAWKSGDFDLAADRLTSLRQFAEGMSNKVAALNTHFAAGNPNAQGLTYQVFSAGQPITSQSKMAVRTHNANSVAFAQKVAREAQLLGDVYNGLVEAFPNLAADHLTVTPLSGELSGPATEVAARYQQARQAENTVAPAAPKVVAESNQAASAPTVETATKQEVTSTPAPARAEPASKNVLLDFHEDIERQADDLQSRVDSATRKLENEFLELDRNENMDPVQRERHAQLDSDLLRLSNVSDIAQAVTGKPSDIQRLQELLPTPLYEEMLTIREQAKAGPPQAINTSAKPVSTQKVEAKPVEAKAEPVVEKETVPEPTVEDTPAPKGVAAAFPGVNGAFVSAFKLPSEQRTRTIGTKTPVNTVRDALKDSASFTAFLGSAPQGQFTKEIANAYKGFLNTAEDFIGDLDDRLQAYLDSPYSKTNPTTMRQVLQGTEIKTGAGVAFDPVRTAKGKALAITETVNGEVVYNPELIQGAILAGLQWFLSSDQYGGNFDALDIAKMTGLPEGDVSDDLLNRFNTGMTSTEAKRSLATKIKAYWGLQNSPDGSIGMQEGIPEAIAAELLEVMIAGKWLSVEQIKLTEQDGVPEARTYDMIQPADIGKDSPLKEMPSAIEQAVMVQPEDIHYIGGSIMPEVATDQLRNPGVKNTPQQREAIANEQATPYFVQPTMAGLYMSMGRDAIIKMFGAGNLDQRAMNKNHAQSMEGVNRSTVAAFDHLQQLLAEVENVGQIDETPIHYAFNMTRVSRLQMLGKYNPQSNKLVREAILPTRATLDLSSQTGEGYKQWTLGLAQMLGVKVHKMFPARSRAKVEAMLSGPLAPAVEALQNWSKGFTNDQVNNPTPMPTSVADTLLDSFKAAGEPLTPMGLHAVMDYARYLNAEDRSAFKTSAYVEADGVTNGPINAMVLFTTGAFKDNWVRNIAKGGLFFNRPGETVNANVEGGDSNDLYQATTDKLKDFLEAMRANLQGNPAATEQINHLFYAMDEFFGKDLSFDGQNLTLGRGIAKNPLTITIYGSGAAGIAGKMTKMLTDAIYERMSQVAQARIDGAKNMAEAMFGAQSATTEEAQQRLERFAKVFTALTTQRPVLVDGEVVMRGTKGMKVQTTIDPVNFTFTADQLANIKGNMRMLFVDPMRDAISSTVGEELMQTAEMLRQATQAQSIVLEHAFKAEVEAALAEKAKDPNWRAGEFLTRKEMDAIHKKLEHLSPLVQTGTQNFYIAGSESSDVRGTEFARSLTDTFNTPAYVSGPKDAGVSGIPFMNIGAGDGQMMQNISVAKGAPTGTLKIFDGMNMPLDQVASGSLVANEAVFDSWKGNPLAAVHKSFSQFMSDAKLTGMNDAQRIALSKALFGLANEGESEADVIQAMTDLVDRLNRAQQSIEARHRVMDRVSISVDQMAAASSPFTKSGDLLLTGTDPDALAEQLSAYYEIELEKIRAEAVNNTVDNLFAEAGVKHESGVTVLSGADISSLNLPENQKAVVDQIAQSLAAKDYTIVLGNAEQVAAYNEATGSQGMSSLPSGDVKGYTNVGTKQIVLLNPSSETFVHELIHAATFEAVDAHYAGETNKAVPRIEAMMEQFLAQATELTQTSEDLNAAYNSAASAIRGAPSKAAALNEFMAWTLANENLARLAQRTRVSKLARMAEKVISLVKDLLGIKQNVGQDVFSNLLFNSTILMYSDAKIADRFKASTLFQNSTYGDSDRLTAINEALDKTIGRYLNEAPQAGKQDQQSVLSQGIQNAIRVAKAFQSEGFMMNMQEASTFETIVTALSTEAAIDPNAMAAVQQLYAHVMKNLKVESFMQNEDDRYYAAKKFDVLSGKTLVTRDSLGRSSLLPAFLALATTNDEFRAVLSNIPMPKTAINAAGTIDALLENVGNSLIDKLSARMSGVGKKPANVAEALDNLNAQIAKVINDRETYIDQTASKAQGVLDRSNELVIEGMDQLSAALLKNAKRASTNARNKLDRAVAGIGAGIAAVINDTAAEGVAQATMENLNRSAVWTPVRDLIGDLVGRTKSNANVYDMIKAVRSFVQRTRQQYRELLPETLNKKFTRELTADEKASLHTSLGKTDIAVLGKDALELATDAKKRADAISVNEIGLSKLHISKAKQLANYMLTGKPGTNLLRNAEAVARLLGENQTGRAIPDVAQIDRLVTLYALDQLSAEDKSILSTLAQNEAEGLNFSIDYLRGQRADELSRATGRAKMNAFKGYIPNMINEGMSMIVAHDSQYDKLMLKSYTKVGQYTGSIAERGFRKGYYFIPVASRGAYEQGIMQNVVQTAGGVNAASGLMIDNIAGAITDPAEVKSLVRRINQTSGSEPLMPVYDESGQVVAFERSTDPEIMSQLYSNNDLTKAIGVWRGRQIEEAAAQAFNEQLIDRLHDMYAADKDSTQYVDVFATKDPVIKDAASLFSQETRAYIESTFGNKFMVRRDMLNDALGYRSASIGDAWTGTTRWKPEVTAAVQKLAVSFLGNNAYKTLVNAEKTLQQVVSDAKVLIVVKSVIVPAVNMISNLYQLASRGVPLANITKSVPAKLTEVEAYTKSLVRRIEAEAELRAATDTRTERRLKTEIQAINDSHRRMSIWPLIEAGEFSGISDAGLTRGEVDLTSGRMQAYMESLVNKLPEKARTIGRYALVTKDTALYQGLQKSVEYGDFIAKAVLFDDLMNRKGMTKADALARITEEFVNYDRLSGRFRSTMENMGLLWFYNFKIRSVKVALSMVRNNPVHALLATLTPSPTVFGNVGLPTEDNLITKLMDGSIWRSIGPGQGFHAASLNPWYNLTQ